MKKENKFFRFAILCAGIVALSAFVSCATTGYGTGSKATISVVGDGIPGKAMKINGAGFLPGEVIELVLEMEDVPIIVGIKGKHPTKGRAWKPKRSLLMKPPKRSNWCWTGS